jgi:hypothetical protein
MPTVLCTLQYNPCNSDEYASFRSMLQGSSQCQRSTKGFHAVWIIIPAMIILLHKNNKFAYMTRL